MSNVTRLPAGDRPIDIAYEHCSWAKRCGFTPREVIESIDGDCRRSRHERLNWIDAVMAVARECRLTDAHCEPRGAR